MKKNLASFLRISALVVLTAVMALSILSCAKEEETAETGAEITITVAVTNDAGATVEHEVKTTAADLGTALVESGIVEDNQDQYGLYILVVDGVTADYSVDASYWALSKDGEMLMTGASQTPIADGDHFELVYTKS